MTGHRKRRDSGMTLVEVMTVLVIIALMTSAVMLSRPKAAAPVKTLSDEMVVQLNSAAQDSVITGRAHGFGLSDVSYAVYTLEEGQWEEQAREDWPESISITLEQEGEKVKLPDDPIALIVFDPTGISTPFELILRGPQGSTILRSTGNGRVVREAGR